jgi:glycosyltransferase involved in cell wall biosynthesis
VLYNRTSIEFRFQLPEELMAGAISVIIPVFNSATLLERAISSVRAQTGFDLEIIAVDDGSTDNSLAVLRRIAAKDMKILSQPNAGPGAARNAGIMASSGEWIAFLDADDYWIPGKLEAQMTALDEASEPAFSYADSFVRNSRGDQRIRKVSAKPEILLEDLLHGPGFFTSSVIMRRTCFDRIGLFNPNLRSGEDWDMWLRASAEFQGCYVAKALSVYRLSEHPDKYSALVMEACTLQVVARILANPIVLRDWPSIIKSRRRIFAWHCSVLAKTYLRQNKPASFLRLSCASLGWHPMGAYYLLRSWRKRELPRLVSGPRRELGAAKPLGGQSSDFKV